MGAQHAVHRREHVPHALLRHRALDHDHEFRLVGGRPHQAPSPVGRCHAHPVHRHEIDDISSQIAAAVEQQGAATREIAGNVLQAANGTKDVNANILSVGQASEQSGRAVASLQDAANGLSSQSERLKSEVDRFLGSLRVA